jgi:hypothetical protein
MSIQKSIYEVITLESNDTKRRVDIRTGAISIDYYEDIFSPTITAKIKVVNTGNSIVNESGDYIQSIYNGLPLRGGERLSMKIYGNSDTNPGLDFSKNSEDYFYVSSITDVISQTNQESFTLNLVSREAITNETSRVGKKFSTSTKISDSVREILEKYLKTKKIGTIDSSSNPYGFIGNMRKPFTVLVWLAPKAVPDVPGKKGTAGFFFYQTQDGFQFRSIDSLINSPVRKNIKKEEIVFTYTQVSQTYNQEDNKVNNDYRILNYYFERNNNLIEKLRLGTYSSERYFFNPLKGTITPPEETRYTLENYSKEKSSSLGVSLGEDKYFLPKISDDSDETLASSPTRIITGILDVGTLDSGISKSVNLEQTEYQSQSLMRYNVLFTHTLNVMIPSNTNLRAGDVIECRFPKVTSSKVKEYDMETSGGLYMIKELCHHFDANRSYTSLKLVRDTFGIQPKK